ncbi:hypothetical protein GW889_01050 [Candidatus Berkelbacteria bacterium]|nr:hypothetical protein [Candidatus Berkelbacteria bacterium]OIP06728.1 MAG: hypothetical protein AUK41_01715 [Candidatus Berkelbacteria bacterium CG2_30_43_20]PIU87106.1 MAG: hypothetical protein COS66_02655 [Candidatus Berkelbacteria bacterium CG06_land_8_20_14_3_00_43_10]
MEKVIGLKELRENTETYISAVSEGQSFLVIRRAKPVFKLSPVDDENWEEVVDFTKIQKGGVVIDDILSRL